MSLTDPIDQRFKLFKISKSKCRKRKVAFQQPFQMLARESNSAGEFKGPRQKPTFIIYNDLLSSQDDLYTLIYFAKYN